MQHLTLGYLTVNDKPIETIMAAASAGFRSVGIRISGRRVNEPYTQVIGNPAMIREIRDRCADNGLRLSNISSYHLFPDVQYSHMQSVIDTTAALGSKILVAHAHAPLDDKVIDLFARYTEYAARSGISIAVEYQRFTYAKTLKEATDWLDRAGQPNAGYMFDPLHVDRAGGTMKELAAVDPKRIVFVQICDAKKRTDKPTDQDLIVEARTQRLDPGEGDLSLYDYLDAFPADIEIEHEVPRPEYPGLHPNERARRAAQHFHDFMAKYAKARGRPDPWPGTN